MSPETRGPGGSANFERVVLPHLDAAYNLARWLVHNPHDAEEVVQEACLRAFKFLAGYHGGDARAWLLKIVRNTGYSFLEKNRRGGPAEEFDEEVHVAEAAVPSVEATLLKSVESRELREALQQLPARFREVLVLREMEEMSYKEIADVLDVPIGTVMSSLARGRTQLKEILLSLRGKEASFGLRK
jgi:RNA polymerase sigma-70 factor (ECF subfamily)